MRYAICLVLLSVAATTAAAESPLVRAVKIGDAVAVRALLKQRVDVNVAEADGTTALHYAVQQNDAGTVAVLIRAGATVTAANRYGITPLQLAATIGSTTILGSLLQAGADPNTATPEGETVLMTAARTGDAVSVKLLAARGANVNARESGKGQTALMWAAAENNTAAITALIEAGAEVNARSKADVFTPFLFAVRAGHVDASRLLLDAGADVNHALPDGTSPLVLATINGHYELASYLLDRGANPNADGQGWTALHQIVWTRRPNTGFNLPGAVATGGLDSLDLAHKLVKLGANVNARQKKEPKDGFRNQLNRIGATPFLLAAKSVDLPLMRLLLELGANPAITTEDGATALMAAAGVGIWAPGENPGTDDEAVAALKLAYEAGAGDVNAVDGNGDTAMHGAVYRAGSIGMLSFLIEKGARLDVRNKKGWTPLIAADGVEYTPNVLKRYPETAAFLRKVIADRGQAQAAQTRVPPIAESHPVLAANLAPFERYISSESTLSPRDRELLILRTAWLCRSAYVWAQHAPEARKAGLTAEELTRIARGPEATAWNERDAALLRAADELHVSAFVSDPVWRQLADRYDTRQMMDAVFTVAEFTMVSGTANSLRLPVDASLTDRLPDVTYRVATKRNDQRLIGATARITPLEPSEWTPDVRQWLDPTGSGRPVAAIYRTYARHLTMDRPRTRVSEHIRQQSTLTPRVRELLIMRIGWLCRSEYEWAAHAPAGRRAGMTAADVARVIAGPNTDGDPFDAVLLRAVDELHRDDVITEMTWNALAAHFDAKQLLDVLTTIGGYRMVSMALNTFGVQLEPGAERFPETRSRS